MEEFVDEVASSRDTRVANRLAQALGGKGAFRRFKDAVQQSGEAWQQTWYQWRDAQLHAAMKRWLEDLPVEVTEVGFDEDDEADE